MFITTQNILRLIKEQGKTQNQFAIECGLNNSAITEWKKGKANPSNKVLQKIADRYDLPLTYFYEVPDYEYPVNRVVKMNIVGVITAGYDGQAQEEYIGDISFLAESLHGYMPEECFVLRVSGDSMLPELKDGDLVLIHRQPSVDSGDIAAVMYDGDCATLKRVKYV
ncbi:MAG: XRE family transcriptional regulator, partial [Muribaculaceae bacterium]|nr:XRE family transcriptional regulator [Muribaculaceae bacterium]